MKFLNSDVTLCLGAHPDDVEYGMAGTFSCCSQTKFIVLVMSSGGDFDQTTIESNRREENLDVWSLFGNVSGEVIDGFVKDQSEDSMVNLIEKKYLLGVDTVLIPPMIDSHFEHRIINKLGPALCRRLPLNLIEYRTPSTLNNWIPNYFVNLNEKQYNLKKIALKKFVSQQKAPYFADKTLDSFHHNFQCSKKGYEIVESYKIVESFLK